MSKVVPRDVGSFLQLFRKACFSFRDYQTSLRFEDFSLAKRTQPQPFIPGGVSHRIKQNYYFNRDARRLSKKPEPIYIAPATTISQTQTQQLKDK